MPRPRRSLRTVQIPDAYGWPRLLGLRPPPQFQESISSWLARLCLVLGCDLTTFSTRVLAEKPTVWNNDIDRKLSVTAIGRLSVSTGVPEARIERMTLDAYQGMAFRNLPPFGGLPWVLPRHNFKNRSAPASRGQYCPDCLAGDKIPYFRRYWRLSFFTFCPRHRRLLLEGCPRCGRSVGPLEQDFKVSPGLRLPIHVCSNCGTDLRKWASRGKEIPNHPSMAGYIRLLGKISSPRPDKRAYCLAVLDALQADAGSLLDPRRRSAERAKKDHRAMRQDIGRRFDCVATFFGVPAVFSTLERKTGVDIRRSSGAGAQGA